MRDTSDTFMCMNDRAVSVRVKNVYEHMDTMYANLSQELHQSKVRVKHILADLGSPSSPPHMIIQLCSVTFSPVDSTGLGGHAVTCSI